MSAVRSWRRRLAIALVAHAARILPASRSPWADAMRHEIEHIEHDTEALTWAAGCAVASYVERSRAMDLIHAPGVRWLLAVVVGLQAVPLLFATVLTVAWRFGFSGVAGLLGGFTPGDDYRRLIPLMSATPWWLHLLWVTGACLCVVAGWKLLRRSRAAFPIFATAWILASVANLVGRAMPEYREAFSFSTPLFTRDYLIPAMQALVPVLLAVALWIHGRHLPASGATITPDGTAAL